MLDDLPADHRYFRYQETVNAGGAPSEQVIDENRRERGHDFRDETEGEHPIAELRQPVGTTSEEDRPMPTLTPTKADGATPKPDADLVRRARGQMSTRDAGCTHAAGTGVDSVFVADLLSAMLAHERCGMHLYRSVAGRTTGRAKKQYEEFGGRPSSTSKSSSDSSRKRRQPDYVELPRLVRSRGHGHQHSSVDVLPRGLDRPGNPGDGDARRGLLAETVDHANWTTLAALVEQLPDGDLREASAAVNEVEQQEDEHVGWAAHDRG